MKHTAYSSLIAILVATSSFAETEPTISGSVSLGVNLGNMGVASDTVDTKGFNVNADLDFQISDNMTVGVLFSHIESTMQVDYNPTLESTRWGIEPTYHYGNGAYAGLYYQDFTFGVEGLGIGLNSFGVFGGYDASNYAVEVYAGKSETGGIYFEAVNLDATNFGIAGSVDVSSQLELFGHYSVGEVGDFIFEGPEFGTNTLTAVGFNYVASPSLSVFGAVSSYNIDLSDGDPITQAALGIGADLSAIGVDLPGIMTAEWTHTNYGYNYGSSDFTGNTLSVGWTFSFGGSDSKSQNCVINNARGQNRAPLAGAFECINLGGGVG